ncbi:MULTISPECIES: hypothetical protein [Methylomonas]|uniref:Uncharacterized protein n=1 Tax=Methylomonas koyamae TaxID=702114 RepID=A0AA91I7E8_9GAMM|nr:MULTISPECIES: hypothetical protein [Methylomonas]ANE57909.1 hypothetical protein AYM39_21680 [Methylomonas sp. DH-1]OAI30325.1 hypothetical protein A1356_21580 [Methylomonas koyamae]
MKKALATLSLLAAICFGLLSQNVRAEGERPIKLTTSKFIVNGYGEVWLSYYTGEDGQQWPKAHAINTISSDFPLVFHLKGIDYANNATENANIAAYDKGEEKQNPYLKRQYTWFLCSVSNASDYKFVWGKSLLKVKAEELK